MERWKCEGSVLLHRASFTLVLFLLSVRPILSAGLGVNSSIAQIMPFDPPALSGSTCSLIKNG